MPTIVTRGVISARGAGTFAYIPPPPPAPPPPGPPPPPPPPGPPPPGPVLQTVSFYSSGSWTAPAGVTNIVALDVVGGAYSVTPGQWIYSTGAASPFYSIESYSQAGSPSAFFTYEQVGSLADSLLAQMNSGGTGERSITYSQILNSYNPSTNGYWNDFQPFTTITIRGVASPSGGPWDNRSGQPVRGIGYGWFIGAELYFPPEERNGSQSSAFGYTAPGGTQGEPQPVVTAGNIPVTPGQTYSIQVGGVGGLVSFNFYQS